jgi:hypothetical protein
MTAQEIIAQSFTLNNGTSHKKPPVEISHE